MTPHSWASRAAVVCVAVLACLHLLGAAQAGGDTGERVGGLVLGGLLGVTAVGIARGNRFGARLTAVLVCALDLVALLLVVSVGPPGESPETFGLAHAAVGIFAAAVLVLVTIDARSSRDRSRVDEPPPYAL